MPPLLLHATAVALERHAVLLRGPSGAGKSDLGLRLIDAGAALVADDQCELSRRGEILVARAPSAISGLIEVRGVGIFRLAALPEAPVALLVDLVAPEQIERLPTPAAENILGIAVPRLALAPFEASAPAKIGLALRSLTDTGFPAMLRQKGEP